MERIDIKSVEKLKRQWEQVLKSKGYNIHFGDSNELTWNIYRVRDKKNETAFLTSMRTLYNAIRQQDKAIGKQNNYNDIIERKLDWLNSHKKVSPQFQDELRILNVNTMKARTHDYRQVESQRYISTADSQVRYVEDPLKLYEYDANRPGAEMRAAAQALNNAISRVRSIREEDPNSYFWTTLRRIVNEVKDDTGIDIHFQRVGTKGSKLASDWKISLNKVEQLPEEVQLQLLDDIRDLLIYERATDEGEAKAAEEKLAAIKQSLTDDELKELDEEHYAKLKLIFDFVKKNRDFFLAWLNAGYDSGEVNDIVRQTLIIVRHAPKKVNQFTLFDVIDRMMRNSPNVTWEEFSSELIMAILKAEGYKDSAIELAIKNYREKLGIKDISKSGRAGRRSIYATK